MPSLPRLALALLIPVVAGAGCSSPARPSSPGALASERRHETTVEPWEFEDRTGQLIRTGSYHLYTTLSPGPTVQRLPRFMEDALDHYTSAIATLPRPSAPMESYVLASRSQWTRLTQRLMGRDAAIYLRIQRGGFAAGGRALLFFIGPRDTLAIAAHEGWHQYTQSTFQTPLPVWLEEGIAAYMEGHRWPPTSTQGPSFLPWANLERYDTLRTASNAGRIAPLDRLLEDTPQELMSRDSELALSYYAQVWALVHFLREGEGGVYRPALERMLADAAEGKTLRRIADTLGQRAASQYLSRRRGTELLRAYIDVPVARLTTQYQAFVEQACALGNKQRIVQGLSPVDTPTPAR